VYKDLNEIFNVKEDDPKQKKKNDKFVVSMAITGKGMGNSGRTRRTRKGVKNSNVEEQLFEKMRKYDHMWSLQRKDLMHIKSNLAKTVHNKE
jgi:hypothetical protein